MNTRDPFNIRRQAPPSAFAYSNHFSRRNSNQSDPQAQLRQTLGSRDTSTDLRDESYSTRASGAPLLTGADMSSYGQPVPSGRDSRQPSMQPRRATNPPQTSTNGVSEKLGSMLSPAKENEELPMYKDKPYNYSPSQRKPLFYQRWRLPLTLLAVIGALLYLSGAHSKIPESTMIYKKGGDKSESSFGVFGKKKAAANWNERRERVRDAFKVSWAAYEKSAWGIVNVQDNFRDIQLIPQNRL